MTNEIPVARRVKVVKKKVAPLVHFWRTLPKWVYGVAGLAFLLPVVIFTIASARPSPTPKIVEPTPQVKPAPKPQADTLLGHYPYDEAPQSDLIPIGGEGLKLRKSAALSFEQMQRDASAQGIVLVPISAFRSVADQEQLFFEISKIRNQTPAQRAKVSAPPGYSEHHTGYAIDIGDGNNPSTDLSETFAQTIAYEWLRNNAPSYGFELSFPPNNHQGVLYEPWHWRFVGDTDSLKTFYKGRKTK